MNCLNCKKKMRTNPFTRDVKESDAIYGLLCFNGCVIKSTRRRVTIASYCRKCFNDYYEATHLEKYPEWDKVLKVKREEHDREFHFSIDIV